MDFARRRIENELRLHFLDTPPDTQVRIVANESDIMNLKGIIHGVPGTPYEGGQYELEIKIPESYPYQPPQVRFITKIWHPFVSPFDGKMCLKDSDNACWPVSMTIYKILLVIQTWMSTYTDKEALDGTILAQAKDSKEIFEKTAKFWAVKYANARQPLDRDLQQKVEILARHTNDSDLAVVALSYQKWILPRGVDGGAPRV